MIYGAYFIFTTQCKEFSFVLSDGLIEVFVGPSSYKPSILTTHTSSIIVNYVGLASGDTRALYYFGCPIKNVTTIHYDILPTEDFSKNGCKDRNCLRESLQLLTEFLIYFEQLYKRAVLKSTRTTKFSPNTLHCHRSSPMFNRMDF